MVTPKKIEEQFTSIYHYILIGCYCSILFVASAMYCTIPQTNIDPIPILVTSPLLVSVPKIQWIGKNCRFSVKPC